MPFVPRRPFVLLVAASASTAALAQEAAPLDAASLRFLPDWTVRVEPGAGYLAPSGDILLPAGEIASPGLEVSTDQLNIDSPRLGPYGEVTLARDRLRLTLSGLGFDIDRSTSAAFAGRLGDAPVALGDRVRTDFSYASAAAMAGYRFWSWRSADGDLGVALDAIAGVRLHVIDIDTDVLAIAPLAGAATSAGFNETFAEPTGGINFELDYKRAWGIDFHATGGGLPGGDRSSTTFDLSIGFVYRPVEWVGAQIGYRLLVVDFEEGEGRETFAWDGAVAGLFFGLQFTY